MTIKQVLDTFTTTFLVDLILETYYFQKQPSEIIHKKSCSEFHNIHRKTPVLESLFNEVFFLTLLKRAYNTGVFL